MAGLIPGLGSFIGGPLGDTVDGLEVGKIRGDGIEGLPPEMMPGARRLGGGVDIPGLATCPMETTAFGLITGDIVCAGLAPCPTGACGQLVETRTRGATPGGGGALVLRLATETVEDLGPSTTPVEGLANAWP